MFGFNWWRRASGDVPAAGPAEDGSTSAPSRRFADAIRSSVTAEELESIRARALAIEEERAKERSLTDSDDDPERRLRIEFLYRTRCARAFDLSLHEGGSPLPVEAWTRDASGPVLSVASALSALRDEGLALWDADRMSLRVPDVVLCGLPAHFLAQAGLPDLANVQMRIRTEGVAYTPSFEVRRIFIRNGGPLTFPKTDGMVLHAAGKDLLLPAPIFIVSQTLEEFSTGEFATDEERNYAWAAASSILSQSSCRENLEDEVGGARLMAAVRLSIEKDAEGRIRPVFLHSTYAGGEVSYLPMLSPGESDEAAKFLDGSLPLGGQISVGDRAYLFMTPEVRRVVEVIRKAAKGTPEEKASFFANPTKVIVDALENEPGFESIGESIDAIFVETPEYLSQRVEAFGPWEPVSCSFMHPVKTEWFADSENRYGVMIGGDYVWVTAANVDELVKRIEEALGRGESSITFRGQEILVDGADISALKDLARRIKGKGEPSGEASGRKEKEEPEGFREKKKLMGPLLKTNLEELEYQAEQNRHPQYVHPFEGLKDGFSLYPHQVECLEWLEDLWRRGWPGALLADDMGLGKTLQSLSFMKWLGDGMKAQGERKPALIIAPAGLIANWGKEAEKYFGDALGSPIILTGPTLRRFRDLPPSNRIYSFNEAGIVLATYETVRDKIQLFSNVDWGLLILDEAQKTKNPQARLTNAVASLKAAFVLAMTGTPVENSFLDLWSIMNIAVPGFLRSAREFAESFGDNEDIERSGRELNEILTGERAEDSSGAASADSDGVSRMPVRLMMRRLKTERLKALPRKIEDVRARVMPPEQARAYRKVLADRSMAALSDEESIPGLVVLQRLSAASLSPDEMTEETEITDEIIGRSARLTALFEILDEVKARGEKAIVFVQHLKLQQTLARAIRKKYDLDHLPGMISGSMQADARQRVVTNFQNGPAGEFDAVVLMGRAAGTGLTLTAANHVIHLERWWNPAVEDQCSDRAYRIGQTKDVTIHVPLALLGPDDETSFDARLNAFLAVKRSRSAHVLQPGSDTRNAKELVSAILGK